MGMPTFSAFICFNLYEEGSKFGNSKKWTTETILFVCLFIKYLLKYVGFLMYIYKVKMFAI